MPNISIILSMIEFYLFYLFKWPNNVYYSLLLLLLLLSFLYYGLFFAAKNSIENVVVIVVIIIIVIFFFVSMKSKKNLNDYYGSVLTIHMDEDYCNLAIYVFVSHLMPLNFDILSFHFISFRFFLFIISFPIYR